MSCDIRNRVNQFGLLDRLGNVRLETCHKGSGPIFGACVTAVSAMAGRNPPCDASCRRIRRISE